MVQSPKDSCHTNGHGSRLPLLAWASVDREWGLDVTTARSPSPSSSATGQAGDDDLEEGGNASDNCLEDTGNSRDDVFKTPAYCAEEVLDLLVGCRSAGCTC